MVRANKEARGVFLQTYTALVFKLGIPSARRPLGGRQRIHDFSQHTIIYIDPRLDTLYIGPSSNNDICLTRDSISALAALPYVQMIETFACEYNEWYHYFEGHSMQDLPHLSLLPQLEHTIVTTNDLTYEMLRQHEDHLACRPQGEVEFIQAPAALAECYQFDLAEHFNSLFSQDPPPLKLKCVLRGGMEQPRVVRRNIAHGEQTEEYITF